MNHFQAIYELQEETGGFTAFVEFSAQNTALGGRGMGRGDRRGLSEGSGHLAHLSFELS